MRGREVLRREGACAVGGIESCQLSLGIMREIERVIRLRCIGHNRKRVQLFECVPIGEALISVRISDAGNDGTAHSRIGQIVYREDDALLLRLQDSHPVFDFLIAVYITLRLAISPNPPTWELTGKGLAGGKRSRSSFRNASTVFSNESLSDHISVFRGARFCAAHLRQL